MATSLTKRPGKLAGKLNPRTEFHGEDEVGACDFTIYGLMLQKDELNDLGGDQSLWDRLFDSTGPLPEPALKKFDMPLVLIGKYEKATVTLRIGPNEDKLVLSQAKLAKLHIHPMTGGLSELTLQVQCNPDASELSLLYTHMNHPVNVSLRFGRETAKGAKDQPELPMDHADAGTSPNPEPSDGNSYDTQDAAA